MDNSHYPASGEPIVFFDFETTGLSPKKDAIIEVAAVKYVPGAASHPQLQHLIAIDRPLPRFISNLTGITDGMLLSEGRRMDEVLDEFISFIGDHTVVSFNINFDAGFLNAAIERHGRRPLNNVAHCALERARLAWPELPNHKLLNLADHLGLEKGTAHRALNDTLWAMEVYFRSFHANTNEPVKRNSKTMASESPAAMPVITGPRQFRIEVLGTRRYQEAFEAVCGPRSVKGAALDIQVQLRVETSSKAVRVLLNEEVVGNLAPRVALDFRRAIVEGELLEFRHFECSAKIRGGRICEPKADGIYVMWLDLPQDDD
ncbi:MAG: 3'-5' exonuclease [Telluria sp.]